MCIQLGALSLLDGEIQSHPIQAEWITLKALGWKRILKTEELGGQWKGGEGVGGGGGRKKKKEEKWNRWFKK